MPTSELDEAPPRPSRAACVGSRRRHKATGTARPARAPPPIYRRRSWAAWRRRRRRRHAPSAALSSGPVVDPPFVVAVERLEGIPIIAADRHQRFPALAARLLATTRSTLTFRTSRPTRYWGFCVQRSPAEAILQAVALVSGLLLAFGHRSPESEMLLWVLCLCSVV